MTMRVTHHPVLDNIDHQKQVTIFFNEQTYQAYEGDTIASALMAEGVKTLRHHEVSGKGRGVYCNIGHCFECRVRVNGTQVVRACLTPVSEGMDIHSLAAFGKGDES